MNAPRAVILMYHRVADLLTDPWALSVTPRHFGEHLEILTKQAHPAKISELKPAAERDKALRPFVAVTFDDGYCDNFDNARPLLERFAVPATVFLASGFLGSNREYWWDELDRLFLQPGTLPSTLCLELNHHERTWVLGEAAVYSEADFRRHRRWKTEQPSPTMRQELYRSMWQTMQRMPAEEQDAVIAALLKWAGAPAEARPGCRPMTTNEVAELGQSGLVELGAHTVTHPVLSAIPPDHQRHEIESSQAQVEEMAGCRVTSFAYPYGDVTEAGIETLRNTGIRAACTTKPGSVQGDADPFRLPRVHVGDWDGEEFERRLSEWLAA